MKPLYRGTTYVLPTEPCYALHELDFPSPDSRGMRRYQIIVVVRNGGELWEHRRDMGPAKKFKGVSQLRIPGGLRNDTTGRFEVLHTVGELQEIADEFRREPEPHYEPSDLRQAYVDHHDKLARRRKGKVNFTVQKWREARLQ